MWNLLDNGWTILGIVIVVFCDEQQITLHDFIEFSMEQ